MQVYPLKFRPDDLLALCQCSIVLPEDHLQSSLVGSALLQENILALYQSSTLLLKDPLQSYLVDTAITTGENTKLTAVASFTRLTVL